MATRDSGDSNLAKEPGNEVCDIILKLRRHKGCEGECTGGNALIFKETVRFVYFLNLTL